MQPDPSALPLHDALDDRQSHATALDLVARLQGLEHLEYPLGKLRRDAAAVVLDGEQRFVALVLCVDFHQALLRRMVLDGVVDQVAQHLLQRCVMGAQRWQRPIGDQSH